jgi:aspartate/methionine/tyrosine aminotransferase
LITPKTKAIVLVSPNNPGGVEYPAQTLTEFRDLARRRGLVLIVDETYRDFDSRTGRPHDLFTQTDWDADFVQLYSFSKAYRLTGHRVGAVIASTSRLAQVEKFLDTVAICPNQLGQIAALWGMRNLGPWVAQQRTEILARKAAMIEGFAALPAWTVLGCGAYFAYVEHPFDLPSVEVCKRAVDKAAILMLPGSMFQPEGSAPGQRQIRIAFANIDRDGIAEFFKRLALFHP